MNRPTCGTCPHYLPDPLQLRQGACHGAPPQLIPTGPGQITTFFPPVAVQMVGCRLHPQWDAFAAAFEPPDVDEAPAQQPTPPANGKRIVLPG